MRVKKMDNPSKWIVTAFVLAACAAIPAAAAPAAGVQRMRIVEPGTQPTRSANLPSGTERNLSPATIESAAGTHAPWAVWSRFNGVDYDLAWSRWAGREWSPIEWLSPDDSPGDDLDADLAFDNGGRPFVAWWCERGGAGTVFVSVFVSSRWLSPLQVSESAVDSRDPTIVVIGPGEIEVQFLTPQGTTSRRLAFTQPATITDDINPNVVPLALEPFGD